ncbi:MAG: hypothetical protein ACYTHK_00890 [Planctomycetota bacterium]|jgi:uncharacterized membrane protein
MRVASRLHLLRRLVGSRRDFAVRACCLFGVVVIEVLGRRSPTDVEDLYGLGALSAVIALWLGLDREARAGSRRLGRRIREGFLARMPIIGLDLRGEPVLPRGEPRVFRTFAALCALITALELGWVLGIGESFRAFAMRGSYVLMLLLTAVLWLSLLLVLLLAVGLTYIIVHDSLRSHFGDREHRRRRLTCMAAYGLTVLIGMLILPEWIALLTLGIGIALYPIAGTLDPPPPLRLLWRDPDGRVGSFDLYQWVVSQAILFGWPIAIFVVAGLGGRAFGLPTSGGTPITHALASATIWCAGPAMIVIAAFGVGLLHRAMRRDPARRCVTSVHVTSRIRNTDRARELLEARGWRVRFDPEPAERADVRLVLVEHAGPVRWPLEVSEATLRLPEVLDLIARRDVVQRRRLLLKGLEKMIKRARRQSFAAGTGFWIAPHHWFVIGLTRDTAEEDQIEDSTYADSVIGQPYHLALPPAARRHAHEVFAAIEIDIVFVEDGVTWPRLRRVLRRIFEHFDTRGGRIEERHLHGLPGVRCIVHDLKIGEPLDRKRYPEPDYEDLGRARVLHVFKDRGEEEELEPDPAVDEGVPLHA